MTETVATTVVNPPLATAPQTSLLDFALTGLVVALAAAFLYRRLWRSRGACSGCSGGKGRGGCGSKNPAQTSVCVPISSLRTKPGASADAPTAQKQTR